MILRARLGPALALGSALLAAWPASAPAGGPGNLVPSGNGQIHWVSNFQNALEEARVERKFVMVDFYTGWCYWCKVLDAKTYTDQGVCNTAASRLVSVKIDAEAERGLAAKYGVRAFSTVVFLNPDGSLREQIRGFQPPDAFQNILQDVFKMDSELFALAHQVAESPRDTELRAQYAEALAQSGDFRGAAAQLDTLLALDPPKGEERTGVELDRWAYLDRCGASQDDVRKGLENWVKKSGKHPRSTEGMYFLAQANEQQGRGKDARKLYQKIVKADPGSWYAEVAREKLKSS